MRIVIEARMPYSIKKCFNRLLLATAITLHSSQYKWCQSFATLTIPPSPFTTHKPKLIPAQMTISDTSSTYQPLSPFSNHQYLRVETTTIPLKSGTTAQVISARPLDKQDISTAELLPPLVFIHGSFHAAWCWAEHYLPYFASRGYYATALSLRGTGGTFAGDGITSVKISEHVNDVAAFVEYVVTNTNKPACLIGHSFGGAVLMKYLESLNDLSSFDELIAGVGFLCSVPPSGNGKMTMRFLRRSLVDSWKITSGLAMKKCLTNVDLCRTLFFGDDNGIADVEIEQVQSNFARDSIATINISDFVKCLPSKGAVDGRAPFLSNLNTSPLVLGAIDDFIVDREGVQETAYYFSVEPLFVNSPHDVMLGRKWQNGADEILKWLQEEVKVQSNLIS